MRLEWGAHVVWAVYFERSVTRSRGRKVPRRMAVENVRLSDIVQVLAQLGYRYEVRAEKKHPANWFDERRWGYVVVYTEKKKGELLREIASRLRKA